MEIYQWSFAFALVVCIIVTVYARQQESSSTVATSSFKKFQVIYLGVYYAAMFGDWLQGPYVYALYDSYGYEQKDIAILFVAGFGSSAIFGTFIGSLADQFGRKRFAGLYVVLYIASCVTKHYQNYWVLMIGRLLGGIATSLLFSVFDSWMVAEHNMRGFDPKLLSDTFSKQFFGNSVVAILAGLLGEAAAEWQPLSQTMMPTEPYFGGYVTPFDCSIIFLLICGVLITFYWSENFGRKESNSAPVEGLSGNALVAAFNIVRTDKKVFLIGCISSLFEGSMYTFVFLWTPVMTGADRKDIPFGVIFATFMVSCMTGSSLFNVLSSKNTAPQTITLNAFIVASISLFLPVIVNEKTVILLSFLVFEVTVGLYFPSFGTLKGMYVPEKNRSAIYNLFRVPLNAIVLFVLLSHITSEVAFLLCSLMLFGAFSLNILLNKEIMKSKDEAERMVDIAKDEEMKEQEKKLLDTV